MIFLKKAQSSSRYFPSPHLLLLLAILGLAAYLRLYRLHVTPIWGDQSILYSIALDWVNWGKFPLAANKSSAGVMNPPLVEYLIALPLFFRKTVMAPLWFQAGLSLTAVALLFLTTATIFNRTAALLAAFLFALNPWAIYYSRLLWNPSLSPFFATLLLMAVLFFLHTQKWHWFVLAAAFLALLTQIHLSALVMLPVMAVVGVLFWRRLWQGSWRRTAAMFAAGGLVFIFLYLPYLMFERAVGFADIRVLAGVLSGAQLSSQANLTETTVNTASLLILLDLAAGDHFLASQVGAWRAAVPAVPGLMVWMRGLSVTAVLFAALWPLRWRQRHGPLPPAETALVVCALWIILPAALYLRHSQYLQNYFFLYLLPPLFVCLAAFCSRLLLWARQLERPSIRYPVLAVICLPLLLWGGWQFRVYHTGLALAGEVDILRQQAAGDMQQAIALLRRLQSAHPNCAVTLLAEGYQHDSSPVGLVEPFLYPLDVRIASAGRGFIMPQGCAIEMVTATDATAQSLLEMYGTPLATLPTQRGDWHFYRIDGAAFARSQQPASASWQNGLELTGWQINGQPQPGQRMTAVLTWRITQEQPPLTDIHFFNHLLDTAGVLVAQDDAAIVHPVYWRKGDFLVSQFAINLPADLPPGEYTLHAGLYTWPGIERVHLTNGETTFVIERLTVSD